jgi:hypothetical protein
MASKVESNDFDADWGELDFMLLICPGTGDIHLQCRLCQ